ncbi:hypothetical protein Tco_1162781 [Tanacetum coccineum]
MHSYDNISRRLKSASMKFAPDVNYLRCSEVKLCGEVKSCSEVKLCREVKLYDEVKLCGETKLCREVKLRGDDEEEERADMSVSECMDSKDSTK